MDYTESLSFAFEDPHWARKLLIGGLLAFVGLYAGLIFITGFLLAGYFVGVIRNVVRDQRPVLPEWGDLGKIVVDGILAVVISLVYLLVLGVAGALYFVSVADSATLPEGAMVVAIVAGAVVLYLAIKLSIGIALIRFSLTQNLSDAFNLRGIIEDIRADFLGLVAIALFTSILQLILLLAGLAILSPFFNFWGLLVEAHLFGQYGRSVLSRAEGHIGPNPVTAHVS